MLQVISSSFEVPANSMNREGKVVFNFASGLFKDVVGLYYSISGNPSLLPGVAAGAPKYRVPHMYIAQQQICGTYSIGVPVRKVKIWDCGVCS